MSKKDMDMDGLFGQIDEQSEAAKTQGGGSDNRILSFNKTKTVYFRLFPNLKNPNKPMAELGYKVFNWKSLTSPITVYGGIDTQQFDGEPHFLTEKRNELFNQGDKKKAINLFPDEKALVNIYVISDSGDEDNDGKFMVMRYGNKQPRAEAPNSGSPFVKFIKGILADEETGITKSKLFSLGEDGVTIKATFTKGSDGGFPTYDYKFYTGKEIKGFSGFGKSAGSPECVKIYKEDAHDLEEIITDQIEKEKSKFTPEKLQELYNQHILGVSTRAGQPDVSGSNFDIDSDDDPEDEIPMDDPKPSKKQTAVDSELDLDDLDLDDLNLDD